MPSTIADFLGIARRRWWLIVGTPALVTIIAAVAIWQMPVRYRAETELLLDAPTLQLADIKAAPPAPAPDATMIRNEIAVLTSRTLAERVAKKLRLADRPDFGGVAKSAQDPDDRSRRFERAVGTLLTRLNVQNDGRSLVLKIQITSAEPRLAADIANTYAALYMDQQVAAKEDATRRAMEWLKGQIATLRGEIADATARIANDKQQQGITAAHDSTVTAQELAEINSQLIAAHSDRVQKEAAFRYAKQVIDSPDGTEAAWQVLSSPLIQRLREQKADLLRRLAEMSTRYQPEYPEMVRIKAELDDLRRKMAEETIRVVRAMADEASAAENREEALKANLAELTKSAAQQESGQTELRELERETDTNRVLYETLLTRFKQISAQQDFQQPDAYVIARAEPSTSPSGPNKRQLLATPAILSLLFGMFLAFGIEQIDPSFRRSEDIEEVAGLPVLGVLPSLEGRRSDKSRSKPNDEALTEALRGIRSGLRHAQSNIPIGVLLVTSSRDREGKTFFAVSLGKSVVSARLRCLVIDCHFQKPGVADLLMRAPAPGVLAPAQATGRYPQILVDKPSGLHYLPAPSPEQRRVFRSQDLFSSQEMHDYILRLRGHYDLIILDAPPTLNVADLNALDRLADTTIFLVRWGRTPRDAVMGALRALARRGSRVAGVVLSRVDLDRYAAYGYGDYVRHLRGTPARASRGS